MFFPVADFIRFLWCSAYEVNVGGLLRLGLELPLLLVLRGLLYVIVVNVMMARARNLGLQTVQMCSSCAVDASLLLCPLPVLALVLTFMLILVMLMLNAGYKV